jgi:hypothetical protein
MSEQQTAAHTNGDNKIKLIASVLTILAWLGGFIWWAGATTAHQKETIKKLDEQKEIISSIQVTLQDNNATLREHNLRLFFLEQGDRNQR